MDFRKDKLGMTKLAAEVIAAAGVSKVVNDVIENNTESETAIDDIRIKTGSFVLSFMLVDYTTNYVTNVVQGVVDWWKEAKDEAEATETSE